MVVYVNNITNNHEVTVGQQKSYGQFTNPMNKITWTADSGNNIKLAIKESDESFGLFIGDSATKKVNFENIKSAKWVSYKLGDRIAIAFPGKGIANLSNEIDYNNMFQIIQEQCPQLMLGFLEIQENTDEATFSNIRRSNATSHNNSKSLKRIPIGDFNSETNTPDNNNNNSQHDHVPIRREKCVIS